MARDSELRVLICRLSHVGDCILTVPMLNALRDYYHKATIVWAVEPPADQLLRGHPALDELIVLPRGWRSSPRAIWRVRQQLRRWRFDLSLDPQSLTKSAVLGWLAGAPQRLGLARPWARELAPLLNNQLVSVQGQHVVDRSLQLLQPLGISQPRARFTLPQQPQARLRMDRWLHQACLGCGYAVVNPGAGWRSRLWSAKRFGAVARHLGQRHQLPSVVTWAGNEERSWAMEIVDHSGGHSLLAPRTDLQDLAWLLRRARLFVGCDTGPMHLAVAVGTRSVVLHGPTRPELSGPYGPGHIAVQRYYQAGTSRQRRRGDNAAMLAIQVDDVCAACDELLTQPMAA